MNKEEEKAIFWIKGLEDDKEYLTIEQRQAIHIVLNLIGKLQKENQELKEKIREFEIGRLGE